MSIDFTIPTDGESLHVADALVRKGAKVLATASLYLVNGQLVAEGPADHRLDANLEAAILEGYEITERCGF